MYAQNLSDSKRYVVVTYVSKFSNDFIMSRISQLIIKINKGAHVSTMMMMLWKVFKPVSNQSQLIIFGINILFPRH